MDGVPLSCNGWGSTVMQDYTQLQLFLQNHHQSDNGKMAQRPLMPSDLTYLIQTVNFWMDCSDWYAAPHCCGLQRLLWTYAQCHGGQQPSNDDSFHSSTVISPSANKSIMKHYHPSANDKVRCDCMFADNGNAS